MLPTVLPPFRILLRPQQVIWDIPEEVPKDVKKLVKELQCFALHVNPLFSRNDRTDVCQREVNQNKHRKSTGAGERIRTSIPCGIRS